MIFDYLYYFDTWQAVLASILGKYSVEKILNAAYYKSQRLSMTKQKALKPYLGERFSHV